MRKLLCRHKVYIPRVYEAYGGPAVIVMEYLEGVLMSDYLQAERNDAQRLALWCEQNNVKPRKVGTRLLLSFYRRVGRALSTLDASLNVLLGDTNPTRIIRKYKRAMMRRRLRGLRKQGLRALSAAATTVAETAGYAADTLRRRAIQFEGALSTGALVGAALVRIVRWGLLLALLVLAYDLLHQRYAGALARLLGWLRMLDPLAIAIPPYPVALGLLALLLVVLLWRALGRLQRSLLQKKVRLPDGRLDP